MDQNPGARKSRDDETPVLARYTAFFGTIVEVRREASAERRFLSLLCVRALIPAQLQAKHRLAFVTNHIVEHRKFAMPFNAMYTSHCPVFPAVR